MQTNSARTWQLHPTYFRGFLVLLALAQSHGLNARLWLLCRKIPSRLVHLKWIQVCSEVSLPCEMKKKKVDNWNILCRSILNYNSMVDTPALINEINFLLHQMNLNMCPPPHVETWVLNDCQAVALWPPRWVSPPPWMALVRHPAYHSEKERVEPAYVPNPCLSTHNLSSHVSSEA